MTEYRRFYIPKAIWLFTVNLAERKNNHLLIDKIDELRNAFRYVKQRKPFHGEDQFDHHEQTIHGGLAFTGDFAFGAQVLVPSAGIRNPLLIG